VFKKILLAAVAPLAVLGSVVLAGAANAAPLYMDTSVSTFGPQHVDSITNVTATFADPTATVLAPNTATSITPVPTVASYALTFGATDLSHTPAWSIASTSANLSAANGYTVSITQAGVLTVTATASATFLPSSSVTVEATDTGGAKAFATVTSTAVSSPASLSLELTSDTVTNVHGTDDNANSRVDFVGTDVPAGSFTYAPGNLPNGVMLASDGVLSASTAVPGTYHNVTVTATDGQGAAAVETLSITVTGHPVHTAVPVLSHGHAVSIAPTREDVLFTLTGPATWVHFTIAGPGAINGHQGWVWATPGVNEGVYSGLEAHHGYAVFYTPVTAQFGTTPVPGSHGGYVFFVTDTNGLGLI
jgi:hypothetical protein